MGDVTTLPEVTRAKRLSTRWCWLLLLNAVYRRQGDDQVLLYSLYWFYIMWFNRHHHFWYTAANLICLASPLSGKFSPLTTPFPFHDPPAPAYSIFGPLRSVFQSCPTPLTCSGLACLPNGVVILEWLQWFINVFTCLILMSQSIFDLHVNILLVMAALWNRADHYIFMLWFVLFFPRLISAVGDWMSTILPHMLWP